MGKIVCNEGVKELSLDEIKLLSIIVRLVITERDANKSNMDYIIDRRLGSLMGNWEYIAQSLISKGVIKIANDKRNQKIYKLTELGQIYKEDILRNNYYNITFYNEFYEAAEKSNAHNEFCELVYGKDLCQHGMMDMVQLEKLVYLLNISNKDKIIDIGCGNGYITEYISDITNAEMVGIDIADEAIESANKRTAKKSLRIQFESKGVEVIDYDPNTFDRIISIDSLYFVRDLESTILKLNKILKDDGIFAAFYFFPRHDDDSKHIENSRLGKVLEKFNFKYNTFDFTDDNKRHWQLKEEVLIRLKSKFEEEDSMFLFNNRMEECKGTYHDFYRYLYIIEKNCLI